MSGGTWGYLSTKMEDIAEGGDRLARGFRLLAEIEHELDWGYAGDTCPNCAERRVIAALNQYFHDNAYSEQAAVAIVRDRRQNLCAKDQERELARPIEERMALR